MQCPQCGTRAPLGSSHCSSCGKPFTRAASKAQDNTRYPAHTHTQSGHPPANYSAHVQPAQQHPRQAVPPQRHRGRGGSCLLTLLVMLTISAGIAILLVVATNLYVKPRIAEAVSENIGAGIEETVRDRVTAELADLPAGTITISQAEINQRIAEQGNLGPVDDLNVTIGEDGVSAGLSAYGLSGSYTADIVVEDGRITLSNGSIGGPLQYVVSQSEIEQITSDTINRVLTDAGYQVESVTLEDGSLVLNLARHGS